MWRAKKDHRYLEVVRKLGVTLPCSFGLLVLTVSHILNCCMVDFIILFENSNFEPLVYIRIQVWENYT